jgi:hypothetical protein
MVYYGSTRCLLWFITDITDFYYENYGAFTRKFTYSEKARQIRPENPTFGENWTKTGAFFITDITEFFLFRNITENYNPLCFPHVIGLLFRHWGKSLFQPS